MNNKVNHQNLLKGLLMLLAILFVMPQGALAQTKYKITTDGNCEVYYYDNFERIVVTEAEAGQELSVRVKADANPGSGKYFTGEFTLNGSSLGSTEWGYNEGFTMPAEAVMIKALQADKQTLSVDLTTMTRQEVPPAAALLFNGDGRLNYNDELGGYDVNNSGVADMTYYDVNGEHIYVQRLAGSDATGTYTLSYPDNRAMYGSISFVFSVSKKTVQSTWITVNTGEGLTYNGSNQTPGVTVTDGTKDITGEFDVTYSHHKNAGEATAANAPTVTVTAKATSTSYTGSASKTFTIAPKKVTISGVKAKDKIYDGTTSAVIDAESAIIDGKVEGDVLTVNAQSVTAVFADAEAGKDKPVTVSGFTLAGDQAGNYTLSAQPTSVTGTIVPKPVTVESGLTVSSTTLNEITGYSVDATNVKIVGAVNNEKLSIRGVVASLQNGSTEVCNLEYTNATIVIGVDKANNYVLAQQGNQATAEITASTETVVNEDGSTIETATTRVKNADGSITETIKKKVTNPDGTETTTENTKETVTNPDGTETTTENTKETVTNPDGTETTTENTKETVTNPDGSITETIKETVTDKDGKVIQTTETIKKKVTNPDGTKTTTENTKETVTNPDGTETTTENTKETVTNPDGAKTTTENTKETVTDKDGKVIQTTETIKKKVTNPDGTKTTTENTKETVTNPDGTETTTENTKETVTNPDGAKTTTENTKETVTDKDGKVLQTTEAITTTATGADGSQTITTSKTPETDANEIYSIAADGKVTKVDADGDDGVYGDVLGALSRGDGNIINTVIQSPSGSTNVLVRKSDASNVSVTKQVKTDAQGKITALSGSMTVMQTGGADGTGDTGPTQIAFDFGFKEYGFNVDNPGHGNVSVSPTNAGEGEWVTIIAVPDNGYKLAKLYVTDGGDYNGETNGIRPTQSASDPNQYTFQIPSSNGIRTSSSFTIHAIFEAVSGGTVGGGSAIVIGCENKAATTVTINYQTKKATDGGVVTADVSGGKSRVTVANNSVAMIGGTVDKIIGGGTRGATAEPENDEIEIVSGQEYKILHDGYIVLNFYTPDGSITVNSIIIRRPGDANNDGYLNAADLVEMVNAKNDKASERFNLTNADIDRDGTITQTDIDAVVKLIMEQTDEE